MDDQTLFEKLDSIISDLGAPMSASETKDGWTAASKKQFHDFFIDLKQKLQAGEMPPKLSIGRGMDFAGITEGVLIENATEISNELNRRSGHSRFSPASPKTGKSQG
jgi:hypothetical protein